MQRSSPRWLAVLVAGCTAIFAAGPLSAGLVAAQATPSTVTVQVAHDPHYGAYLTDAEGLALYVAAQPGKQDALDTSPPPVAACYATCLQVWPPLLSDAAPKAGPGVQADLLGTVKGPNGGQQVSYNGWPLYTFAADTRAGDAYGQDVVPPQGAALGAAWYLIAPDGSIIQTPPPQ